MTTWTLHGDILCEDDEPLLRLKPSDPGGWAALRCQSAARKVAAAQDLLAAAKSTRLMLYAWKAARANFGLADDHGELNASITELEAAIAKAEGRKS